MPFEHGLYPLLQTPMAHFEFSDSNSEDVLYLEGPFGDLIVREGDPEDRGDVNPTRYLDLFWTVEHIARKTDALVLLEDALDRLPRT